MAGVGDMSFAITDKGPCELCQVVSVQADYTFWKILVYDQEKLRLYMAIAKEETAVTCELYLKSKTLVFTVFLFYWLII